MIKKIVLVGLLSVLVLTSCEKYPNEEWRINNDELANEYYPKYQEHTLNIINEYGLNYTIKDMVEKYPQVPPGICTKFTFEDDVELNIYFSYHGKSAGRISLSLLYINDDIDSYLEINTDYYAIMHRINEFCTYGLHGNEETYYNLLVETHEKAKNSDEKDGFSDYIYYNNYALGYSVRISSLKEYNYISRVHIEFYGCLTDKNVWDR